MGDFGQSQVISERESVPIGCSFNGGSCQSLSNSGQTRQRWSNMNQYSVTVMPISHLKCFQKHLVVYCLAVKLESFLQLVGGAWYFLNLSQHGCHKGHKLYHFTAKQYTTRCVWNHFTQEIGITPTEYWFTFDQPSLTVWSEFASDWQLLRDGRLQLGSDWLFPSSLWYLVDAIRSTWFLSDYLSHALLSGYSDRFMKITFFNHICSISTYCCFNSPPWKFNL